MKAIVQHKYGSPDVLKLEEIPKPPAGDNEELVRVQAASVNTGDWYLMRANPFLLRLMFGLLKPKHKILGADVAGQVEAVGRNVKQVQPGDEVFGVLSGCGFGAFAEYVCVPENAVVTKPTRLSFEEAAAVPTAALTALQSLHDKGQIQPKQKVLINSAAGGVGSFAVQIAKSFGAKVTGACSTRNLGMVRSIGADHVIDYTHEDFTKNARRYDLIVDAAAYRPPLNYWRVLSPKGNYVLIGGSTSRFLQTIMLGPWMSVVGGKKMGPMGMKPNQVELVILKYLIEAGTVTPIIDRRYKLSEVPLAIRYLETGHARGIIVITV